MTAARRRSQHGTAPHASGKPIVRRCAVYTRKSSEEGLEQEYNSLHAQREACEAYIRSQQHEGWRLAPAPYDDGGISGGTMVRPALQALLAEVRAGQIDVIVVYKVDRLTRSLADFAKMVELFDAAGASFVAVTQQFNTTTSMGRLTLNVLLSFAQFEREVTSERIRDKIAASKRKGMWMGGRTPLGYLVQDRKLVADPAAALRVVALYQRYLELGSVTLLKAEMDERSTASDIDETAHARTDAAAGQAQSRTQSRGALYALLSNPVYIGQIRHKDDVHPGQHQGIVPPDLFAAVQQQLASANNGERGRRHRTIEASPLAGKLFDEAGERLVPSHARKGERRYRYYVSRSLVRSTPRVGTQQQATHAPPVGGAGTSKATPDGWRLPAEDIERNVATAVMTILHDGGPIVSAALAAGLPVGEVPQLRQWIGGLVATTDAGGAKRDAVLDVVERVEISTSGMALTLAVPIPRAHQLGTATLMSAQPRDREAPGIIRIERFVPHQVRQRGVEMRLVLEGGLAAVRKDPALLKVVARAHCWFDELVQGRVGSARELAQRLGVDVRYVQRVLRLAMLAPSIVEAIAAGHQDAGLTVDALAEHGPLPLRWSEQAERLRS